VNGLKEGAAKN